MGTPHGKTPTRRKRERGEGSSPSVSTWAGARIKRQRGGKLRGSRIREGKKRPRARPNLNWHVAQFGRASRDSITNRENVRSSRAVPT